jgi:CheY-like chemotaxis protein
LGLWISKGIVERHYGSVGVHSKGIGHGSIFEIRLPVYLSTTLLHQTNNSSTHTNSTTNTSRPSLKNFSLDLHSSSPLSEFDLLPSRPSSESGLSSSTVQTPESIRDEQRRQKLFFGLKVLIVDDAPMVRKLMTKLLSSKGALCDCAEDGAVAVEMMRSTLSLLSHHEEEGNGNGSNDPPPSPYDIVFMDFMMPNMNGPEATKAIRSLGYHGPIIGITGNMMASDVDYFMESGANVILPKPLSVPNLEDYLLGTFSPF